MKVKLKGVTIHAIDKDKEIEIEKDGWSTWISIDETKKLINFLSE
jgi:hypothetical protein